MLWRRNVIVLGRQSRVEVIGQEKTRPIRSQLFFAWVDHRCIFINCTFFALKASLCNLQKNNDLMEGKDHFIHQQCVLCYCALYRQEDKFLWSFLNSLSEQQQKIHLILWLPWLNRYPCSLDINPSITIRELLTPGGQLSFSFILYACFFVVCFQMWLFKECADDMVNLLFISLCSLSYWLHG